MRIDEKDMALLKAASDGLPVCAEPYKAVGKKVGMSSGEAIARLRRMQEAGVIRRITGSVAHRKAGFTANAMVVWAVPEEKVDETGNAFAIMKEVTHCYARKTAPGWPYNLYTMIHGKSKVECDSVIAEMSRTAGLNNFSVLYSTRELKKTSPGSAIFR